MKNFYKRITGAVLTCAAVLVCAFCTVYAADSAPEAGETYSVNFPDYESNDSFDGMYFAENTIQAHGNGNIRSDKHGATINPGCYFTIKVEGKADIMLVPCIYSAAGTYTLKMQDGTVIGSVSSQGNNSDMIEDPVTISYNGGETVLTLVYEGAYSSSYLHSLSVKNYIDENAAPRYGETYSVDFRNCESGEVNGKKFAEKTIQAHGNITVRGDAHGCTVYPNDYFTIKVKGKANIVLHPCVYSAAGTFTLKKQDGTVIGSVSSKGSGSDSEEEPVSIKYAGGACELTLVYSGSMSAYLHGITVENSPEEPQEIKAPQKNINEFTDMAELSDKGLTSLSNGYELSPEISVISKNGVFYTSSYNQNFGDITTSYCFEINEGNSDVEKNLAAGSFISVSKIDSALKIDAGSACSIKLYANGESWHFRSGNYYVVNSSGKIIQLVSDDSVDYEVLNIEIPEKGTYYFLAPDDMTSIAVGGFTVTGTRSADVDGDGEWTSKDASMVLKHLSGVLNFDEKTLEAADGNENGKINIIDVILMLQNAEK